MLSLALLCASALAAAVHGVGLEQDAPCGRMHPLSHYASAEAERRANASTPLVASMLAPVRMPTFYSLHLEQLPMYVQKQSAGFFSNVFDLASVDAVLSANVSAYTADGSGHLRHGLDWKVVKRVVDEHGEEWSSTVPKEHISVDEAHQLFDKGWSVVINRMEHRWPSVNRLAQAIEDIFGPRVQVNLYLTPANAQAFEAHFDWMDGFIVQIHGNKRWKVYDTLVMQPRPDMRFKPSQSDVGALGEPLAELLLEAGDVLYVPAGFVHQAVNTQDDENAKTPSLHLTFGMEVGTHYSWEVLLHHIVDAALDLVEECRNADALAHESWGLRCVDRKYFVDMHPRCPDAERSDSCSKRICSLPLRHLLHQTIGYLASLPEAWELRRVVPITDAMRRLGCGSLGFHHCILQSLTANIDKVIVMLQQLPIEDVLAYGNYSGLYAHWGETGQVASYTNCIASGATPSDLAKRTDIFPRFLADYIISMQPASKHVEMAPCLSALEKTNDITRCAIARETVPSFIACALEAMVFAAEGEVDDNATILYRTNTAAVVAGWQMFLRNILEEKGLREDHVQRTLASNVEKLREYAATSATLV